MDEVETIYRAAYMNARPGPTPAQSKEFDDFLADEEDAIGLVVKGLAGEGIKSDEDQARWRIRVALTRAANFLLSSWRGKCKECGKETSSTNASGPSRTQCDECAFKGTPTPSAEELYEQLLNVFPMASVQFSTVRPMTTQSRRIMAAWLDSVLLDKNVLPTPGIIMPYSKLLGLTINGKDLFPKVEEEE